MTKLCHRTPTRLSIHPSVYLLSSSNNENYGSWQLSPHPALGTVLRAVPAPPQTMPSTARRSGQTL